MSSLRYRPDIDGLRALAILPVVLYHAEISGFSGGFVGVDVFFVISGFLITSLILKDLRAGEFTLRGFWERRFRRILPALSVMVIAALVVGWFWLLPGDYAALGKEAAAQAVFGSNILFYKQAGYFDVGAVLKPLLHTWSLAVEEQFYIFYPATLLLVWKFKPHRLGQFLLASAIISFILCLIVMHNQKLAFYMLPFRGWELLCGALIAYYGERFKVSAFKFQALTVLGFAGILVPIFLYNNETLFPGWAAVPPCVGTALLIWVHGHRSTWLSKILSLKPLVFIGLVSYSWYLWHWPVIVFVRYNPFAEFTLLSKFLCIFGAFILAVLSWRYIETPVREKRFLHTRKEVFTAAAGILILIGAAGLYIAYTKGLPQRLSDKVQRYAEGISEADPVSKACDDANPDQIAADDVCFTKSAQEPVDFILWGDSQAYAIAPLFSQLAKDYNLNGVILTHHGCESVVGMRKKTWSQGYNCEEFNNAVFDLIKRHKIKTVFLVSGWNSWMLDEKKAPGSVELKDAYSGKYPLILMAGLARTLDQLKALGAHVYVPDDIPYQVFDPSRQLAMSALLDVVLDYHAITSIEYEQRLRLMRDFKKIYRGDVTYIKLKDRFCPEHECLIEGEGYSLYANASHLSARGALFARPVFEPYFKKGF